jgi:pSer/pThr/pTyr-binding forkhead associated (FHA) protein
MLPQRTQEQTAPTEAKRKSARPERQPTLCLSRNGRTLQELPLTLPRILIGRSDENDVPIPSRYVSRHHILLVNHGGATILIDLNSTNGTYVNSKRVYNCVLANDDVITIDLHSKFVQYSIKYTDPLTTVHNTLGDIEAAEKVIAKALADAGKLLGKEDTDLLPTLSEDVPTVVGYLDDR